jgi:Ca2+:H+ antiporter
LYPPTVHANLPQTAFHASFKEDDLREADEKVIKVSRGTSVVLLLVYVLYLVFQLKSHAYMYESTPQEIIDEESHPGVLADIMNSSSSDRSSSSDSSSSDDSDASGSVATASRRVKQLFKNRRRRKSSASTSTSHTMSALPSVISSPSTERPTPDYFRDPNDLSPPNGAQLGVIGHEAVVDNDRQGLTHALDWAQRTASNETSKSPEPPKRRKKQRFGKKSKKNRNANVEEKDDAKVIAGSNPQPKVSFSDDVEMGEALPASDSPSQGKLTLNMRGLSRARPALSSYLSSTVFFSQPPHPATPGAALPTDAPGSVSVNGLRRTNSLPDRLNRQSAPAPGPLPPYQHQIRKTTSGLSSVPSAVDGVEEPQYDMSRTAAIMLLLISTGLVAICAEFMVDAIPGMLKNSPVNEAFVGLIILPIVGNAAEHVTAVTVAAKNKMDLAIGVAVGSSIQIALFVTPVVVLLGWALDTNMSLYFNLFETISLFVTAFVVNFLVLDGRSNYLEGSLLIAAYVIIALGAFYYPSTRSQSEVGSGVRDGS